MKTKEIEVWTYPEVRSFGSTEGLMYEVFAGQSRDNKRVKAKLLIEIPERKIEITESMLDNALKEYESQGSCAFFKNILKQKLFGEKREG
jgi:hypothetical protein